MPKCQMNYQFRSLRFGIPVEQVYFSDQIHPNLQQLLKQTYICIAGNGYPIDHIINQLQGSLYERLKLKENYIWCKAQRDTNAVPGAFLWVIRHFLGLLPVQLMPRHIKNKKYFWFKYTNDCKKAIVSYATEGQYAVELINKLSKELLRLPQINILLIANLLDLFRKLAVLPNGEPRINKSAIFALVKYFTGSIYFRPFRPGCCSKAEKQYYPLLLYLILQWPKIRNIMQENCNLVFPLLLNETVLNTNLTINYVVDNVAQTTISTDNISEDEYLIRTVPPSYWEFDFLRDTASQTDNLLEAEVEDALKIKKKQEMDKRSCCCIIGSHLKKSLEKLYDTNKHNENRLQQKVIIVKNNCCCTYSNNYDKQWKGDASECGWKFFRNDDDLKITKSPGEICDSNDYTFDDLISDAKSVHSDNKSLDLEMDESGRKIKECLMEKLTNIGWTYDSPQKDNESNYETANTSINVQKSPESPYVLYANVKKLIKEELEQKFVTMNLSPTNEDNEETDGDSARFSKKSTEGKRSLISVHKIKSKLKFLRILKPKIKTKKSLSYEELRSEVKYQKMGSLSSIL